MFLLTRELWCQSNEKETTKKKKRNVFSSFTYVLETGFWKTIDDRELSRRPAVTLRKMERRNFFYFSTLHKIQLQKFLLSTNDANHRSAWECHFFFLHTLKVSFIFFFKKIQNKKTFPVGIFSLFL
jgi:hypothetical protein